MTCVKEGLKNVRDFDLIGSDFVRFRAQGCIAFLNMIIFK